MCHVGKPAGQIRLCLLRAGPRDESCFERMLSDEGIIYALWKAEGCNSHAV